MSFKMFFKSVSVRHLLKVQRQGVSCGRSCVRESSMSELESRAEFLVMQTAARSIQSLARALTAAIGVTMSVR